MDKRSKVLEDKGLGVWIRCAWNVDKKCFELGQRFLSGLSTRIHKLSTSYPQWFVNDIPPYILLTGGIFFEGFSFIIWV